MADDIHDSEQLQRISTLPMSLWQVATGKGWDLVGSLDYSMITIISNLDKLIFSIFHPCQNCENSKCTEDIYGEIRRQEPQVISGPIHANMFKAIDSMDHGRSRGQLADNFVQAVCGDWARLLAGIFRPQDVDAITVISDEHMKTLERIWLKVYDWNHMVKSHFVSLDYNIYIPPHNLTFDSESMICIAKGDRKPDSIICAVWFGVCSSQAVGKQQPPVLIWQQKTEILSELHFQHV